MSQSKLYEYLQSNSPQIIIVKDSKEASAFADVVRYLNKDVLVFPDLRAVSGDDLRSFKTELFDLFSALNTYKLAKKKPLIISPIKTLSHPLPIDDILAVMHIEFGESVELNSFKKKMLYWGYTFVDIVEEKGEVSFRGDIIDIFPITAPKPYRISLFGDEVEEIRTFELETQKSIKEEIEKIDISPAFFALDEEQYDILVSKCEHSSSDSFVKDLSSLGLWHLDSLAKPFMQDKQTVYSADLSLELQEIYAFDEGAVNEKHFDLKIMPEAQEFVDFILVDIHTTLKAHKNKRITLIASNEAQVKQQDLHDTSGVNLVYSPIIVNFIGKNELVFSLNKEIKKKRRKKTSIILDELKPGDYIVHEDYGVGVFEKIEQAEILGGVKDFVAISYQGEERVLIPVENLESIDRYISSGSLPVLDKLGKGSFAKLKDKVKKKLFEIAGEIINLAAARALIKAPRIIADNKKIKKFQEEAGFEYTDDQTRSIKEILLSISQEKVMDRLLSGDVGFGKTEVAMNAIYAAYLSGHQSALIVPTTLLSSQHYKSIRERFEPYDIKIAKLDRFVSTKDRTQILKALESGDLDLVIGTHSLFSAKFKKPGLIIIDEEHKFGVKQKEKLKVLYEKVHLLSMSATPIPRSLNQAMSSIKQMSTLMTPPSERQGVRTFVKEYDEKLLKEVILRELRRGGQLFYVFNSIDAMPIKKNELLAVLPNLRILMLHSKISATVTEKELMRFQNGEYDVLLATSIIESGIHMPTVNTMLIDGADRFGIADLHQLRGRVGRGHVEGYAYFIVNDKENLTDEAKKRLLALESNSFLGAGSVLAYHDLEIRGGGNLVGDAQSGHIKNIGYTLYLRMLEDAIKELSNQQQIERKKVDIKLTISAYISDEVVREERLRLELYRRLSHCEEVTQVYEIEEEAIDRFGRLDINTKQFFELIVIKLLSIEKSITLIGNYGQNISISYENGSTETIKASSKDDDDIIKEVLTYLRNAKRKIL
ncbi:DEAD/DEAH box helicase [Sulfurimonas sp. MAG313]|nr:DEAD/DEAH box helicase [Sulfurimonas sp. MAG313]MDF1881912.1 DEAD/DEAH box helicase [Sulfurimonas sp. MAG313]